MSVVLAEMTPAFADPVHGAQQTFRAVLDAASRPGRVLSLSPTAILGIVPPASQDPAAAMSVGIAAVLLTLLDAETSLRLGGSLASEAAQTYLRFHTGVRHALPGEAAAFNVLAAADVTAPLWATLEAGSDEAPQHGATLIVEVAALHAEPRPDRNDMADDTVFLELRGPGIESVHRLAVTGLSREFWRERIAMQALLPCGVDLLLVCGTQLAAVPRTTRVAVEA